MEHWSVVLPIPVQNSGHHGLHGHGHLHQGLNGGILRRRGHANNLHNQPHLTQKERETQVPWSRQGAICHLEQVAVATVSAAWTARFGCSVFEFSLCSCIVVYFRLDSQLVASGGWNTWWSWLSASCFSFSRHVDLEFKNIASLNFHQEFLHRFPR